MPVEAQHSVRVTRWYRDLDAHQEVHADGGLTIEDVDQIQVGERTDVGGGGLHTEHDGVSEVAAGCVELETRVAQAAVEQDESVADRGERPWTSGPDAHRPVGLPCGAGEASGPRPGGEDAERARGLKGPDDVNRGLCAETLVLPMTVTEVDAVVSANTCGLRGGRACDRGYHTEEECDCETGVHGAS